MPTTNDVMCPAARGKPRLQHDRALEAARAKAAKDQPHAALAVPERGERRRERQALEHDVAK
ncbi:MAG: hypothetical protein ACXVRK_10540 [Gaiellaceae bacterium]